MHEDILRGPWSNRRDDAILCPTSCLNIHGLAQRSWSLSCLIVGTRWTTQANGPFFVQSKSSVCCGNTRALECCVARVPNERVSPLVSCCMSVLSLSRFGHFHLLKSVLMQRGGDRPGLLPPNMEKVSLTKTLLLFCSLLLCPLYACSLIIPTSFSLKQQAEGDYWFVSYGNMWHPPNKLYKNSTCLLLCCFIKHCSLFYKSRYLIKQLKQQKCK